MIIAGATRYRSSYTGPSCESSYPASCDSAAHGMARALMLGVLPEVRRSAGLEEHVPHKSSTMARILRSART